MKMFPLGAELFIAGERADGGMDRHTDMAILMVAFRNFANAPQNYAFLPCLAGFCDV
jgi:hypothetical protein